MSAKDKLMDILKNLPLEKWKLDSADESNRYWENGCDCGSSGDGESDPHFAGRSGFVNYSAKSGEYKFFLSRSYSFSTYTSGENYYEIRLDITRKGKEVMAPLGIDVERLFEKVSKNSRGRN